MPISPVSVAEFKAHARIAFDNDDTYIAGLLEDATESVEKSTGRVLLGRELTRTLGGFPPLAIELPRLPLASVTSIAYVDPAGETQTLDEAAYTLDTEQGRVYPAFGTTWPAARCYPNSVTVTYVAGHEGDAVPRTLKRAVYHLAALWYAQREPVSDGSVAKVPHTLDMLLELDKVHRL